jgi:KaiC/GvpD/RAD55 family RecA-like ATPase
MIGVKHDETLHPYEIRDKGVIVYPGETVMNDEVSLFDSAKR